MTLGLRLGVGRAGAAARHDGLSADFLGQRFHVRAPGAGLDQSFVSPQGLFDQAFILGARSEIGPLGFYVDYAANVPAYSWTESGQAAGIRLEGAGQNVSQLSDKLVGSPWSSDTSGGLVGVATTDYASGIAGPDGVLNSATRIVCDRQTGLFSRWFNTQVLTSAQYTISAVMRTTGGGTSLVCLRNFDVNELKTVTGQFKRFSTFKSAQTTTPGPQIIAFQSAGGDAAFDILARYAQVEANPFPTSVMRAVAGAVSRGADTLIRTVGAELSAGANTFIVSGLTAAGKSAGDQTLFVYDDTTANNRQMLIRDNTGTMRFIVTTAGVEICNLSLGVVADQSVFAVAIRSDTNNFAASLNGNAVVADTSGALPSGLSRLRLGHGLTGAHWYGTCARFDQYPMAFSNAALVVAAQAFFSELGVTAVPLDATALQVSGLVSIAERSATRLRGVRTSADASYAFQHVNPGARVSFKTTSPWVQYEVFFNGLMAHPSAINDAVVTLVDGVEADVFDPAVATTETISLQRTVTLGAGGVERTVTIVWPYWASLDLTKIRLAISATISGPAATPVRKLIVVGDSITQGATATKVTATWAYKLAGLMSAELLNMGYGGTLGGQPSASAIGALAAPHGANAFVVYTIGVNDYLSQRALATFKSVVAGWYATVRAAAPNARIVLVGPVYLNPPNPYLGLPLTTPISDYRAKIAEVVSDNAGDALLEYINGGAASIMTNADTRLSGDLIHPNDTGHGEIAPGLQTASTLLP